MFLIMGRGACVAGKLFQIMGRDGGKCGCPSVGVGWGDGRRPPMGLASACPPGGGVGVFRLNVRRAK